jgi:hypothetical protein
MKFIALIALFLFQDLPYKSKEEFEIKLDYKFKQRPNTELSSTVNLNETRAEYDKRTSSDLLPYLILNLNLLKLNNETRIRITNNFDQKSVSKKVSEGTILPIDLGFTADVKDRTSAHQYTITFLSPEKSETSRIVIHIDEDGSFLVNGEKRGRF